MNRLDLVIRGGTVATAADTFPADVGIRDGRIVALARDLGEGDDEIDATGKLVLPGGIDSHCHIEQMSSSGVLCADDFYTGSVSAAFGGTTTIVPFAAQHRGQSLREVVDAYHGCAGPKAVIDYAFHLIISDPSAQILGQELPALIEDGYTSFKVYMTYDLLQLDDYQMLDVLSLARREGAMTMVHAENHDMIRWLTDRLLDGGHRAPKYHAVSHARIAESEATSRAIDLARLIDVPMLIVHVSGAEAAEAIRRAQDLGLRIYGETCPQYLFLTADDLDREGMEGAKFCCSPPPRDAANQEHIWRGLVNGTFQVFSSDHAPYRFDESGKLGGWSRRFVQADRQRGSRDRAATAAALLRRRRGRANRSQPVRGSRLDQCGTALRAVSAQGHHRHRLRRGPRDLGPRPRGHGHLGRPARQRRIHPLRGATHQGVADHRALSWAPGRRRREASGRAWQWRVPALPTPGGGTTPRETGAGDGSGDELRRGALNQLPATRSCGLTSSQKRSNCGRDSSQSPSRSRMTCRTPARRNSLTVAATSSGWPRAQ